MKDRWTQSHLGSSGDERNEGSTDRGGFKMIYIVLDNTVSHLYGKYYDQREEVAVVSIMHVSI